MSYSRLLSLGAACALPALAQEPLTIEQLIVDAQRTQLAVVADSRASAAESGARAHGWGVALRHGLNSHLELNALYRESRSVQRLGGEEVSDSARSLSLGGNWMVHREDRLPALLMEVRAYFRHRDAGVSDWFDGYQVALTTYRSIDPVVLSLRVGRQEYADLSIEGRELERGGSWIVEPRVSFAVNHRVTLYGGLFGTWSDPSLLGAQDLGAVRQDVGINGGFAYAPTPRQTVFVNAETATGNRSAVLGLQWYYTF